MKTKHVAAAIIKEKDRIFATERGHGEYIHYWEFPGGKVEPGETPEEACIREIREELDIAVQIDSHFATVEYDYPDFHLIMDCFLCSLAGEKPHLLEHLQARWLSREDLRSVNWLPADDDILRLLEEIL